MPPPAERAQELRLALPDLELAALAYGPPDASPVLALHGWMDSAASLAPLAARLTDRRVVALDLTGHGRSAWRPPGASYQFLEWALDAHDAARALGWRRYAVLGHSLGAALGVVLAATWPDEVRSLTMLDGFAPRTQEPDEAPARLAEFAARRDAERARAVRTFADVAAAAARLAEALGLSAAESELLAPRATRRLADGRVAWARDPRIATGPTVRLSRAHIVAFLRRVRCPALLLRARDGLQLSDDVWQQLRAAAPDMAIEALEGGHHLHLVPSDALVASVRALV